MLWFLCAIFARVKSLQTRMNIVSFSFLQEGRVTVLGCSWGIPYLGWWEWRAVHEDVCCSPRCEICDIYIHTQFSLSPLRLIAPAKTAKDSFSAYVHTLLHYRYTHNKETTIQCSNKHPDHNVHTVTSHGQHICHTASLSHKPSLALHIPPLHCPAALTSSHSLTLCITQHNQTIRPGTFNSTKNIYYATKIFYTALSTQLNAPSNQTHKPASPSDNILHITNHHKVITLL